MFSNTLYHFNPTCELAVANGQASYMPPQILQTFESELSGLFMFCGGKSDFVLMDSKPDEYFIDEIQKIVPQIAQPLLLTELEDININAINPWGWSPVEHRMFHHIKNNCSEEFKQSKMFNWKEEHRDLFNRNTSLLFLKDILKNNISHFINHQKVGEICYTIDDIENCRLRWQKIVVKTPFSSSGRGVFMLKQKGDFENKITKSLNDFGYVITEPFFEKLHDFSLQFIISDKSIAEFKHISHFNTESGGKYSGQLIGNVLLDKNIKSFFNDTLFENYIKLISNELNKSYYAKHYQGWLGIDCMLVNDNGLKMHPVVEVNCRNTMGRLAHSFEKIIHPSSFATLSIKHSHKGFKKENHLFNYKVGDGKIVQGHIPLISMTNKNVFSAALTVSQ